MNKRIKSEFLKIITVNLPESYLDYIAILIDKDTGIYPSRSEYIREAVRIKILEDMKMMQYIKDMNSKKIDPVEHLDPEKYVKIPYTNGAGEIEYKTHTIVKRLEY